MQCRQGEAVVPGCRRHHCEICGTGGGAGAETEWGAMGRWNVVCGDCAGRMRLLQEERQCGACGATQPAPPEERKTTQSGWQSTPDGQWLCGGAGACTELDLKSHPGKLWAARAFAMVAVAKPWLGLESWETEDTRQAALHVAIAACTLHKGGFVGNLIPWSLWRDAAEAQW